MVHLGDAQQKVARAELHLRDGESIFTAWKDANIRLVYARDPKIWIECYQVHFMNPPPADLVLAIGDFLSNAQAALDYTAWEIFLAAGGSSEHRRAGRVYFPILHKVDGWASLFRDKLPMSWPEAEAALRAEQDDQQEGTDNMLACLQGLANSQKHRALHLVAVGSDSDASVIAPSLPEAYTMSMGLHLAHPPIEPMSVIRLVEYTIHRAEDPLAFPVPRDEVLLEFPRPDAPEWTLALTDGAVTVRLSHLVVMLGRVQRAVENLAKLDPPPSSTLRPARTPVVPAVQRVIVEAPRTLGY